MEITSVTFAAPAAGADPAWVLRIEVEGGEFTHRALPLIAMVGDVPVEAVVLKAAADGFVGHLREFPLVGDPLKLGYLETDLVTTVFTYQTPPVV